MPKIIHIANHFFIISCLLLALWAVLLLALWVVLLLALWAVLLLALWAVLLLALWAAPAVITALARWVSYQKCTIFKINRKIWQ